MKVKIEQVNSYTVTTEDGGVHENFTKGSEWNGMIEFKSINKTIIVAKENHSGFESTFAQIFGGGYGKKTGDFDVVKCSPEMVPKPKVPDNPEPPEQPPLAPEAPRMPDCTNCGYGLNRTNIVPTKHCDDCDAYSNWVSI